MNMQGRSCSEVPIKTGSGSFLKIHFDKQLSKNVFEGNIFVKYSDEMSRFSIEAHSYVASEIKL